MFTVGGWAGFIVRLVGGILFARWIYQEVKQEGHDAAPWAWGAFFNWPLFSYLVALRFGNFWYFWWGLFGFLIMPFGILWWSVPYSVAWYIVVLILAVGGPIARRVMVRQREEEQERLDEFERSRLVEQAAAYLEAIPRCDEQSCTRSWEDGNEAYNNRRSQTFHNVFVGTRDEVLSKLRSKLDTAWGDRSRGGDEGRQSSCLRRMVRDASASCVYDWGVNRIGVEIRRFGSDRYAFVEIFVNGEP